MGWPKRVHRSGLIYHITNRGNNRQAVFLEEEDYFVYLRLLYHYRRKFKFYLFAYCLMTNHVHLLVRVDQVSVSKIMQALTIAYTKYYQFKYHYSGHVWQGRFRSPIVSDDDYLLTVMAYIEQNPLRAKMVKDIEDHRFTSYKLNISRKAHKLIDRGHNPVWVSLGKNDQERIINYKSYLRQKMMEDKIKQIQTGTRGSAREFMSERFARQMAEWLPKKRKRGRPRKVRFEED